MAMAAPGLESCCALWLTFGSLQPLLLDTVADLSLRVALRKVTLDDSGVPLVHLDLMLVVCLEIPQLWRKNYTKWLVTASSVT